MAWTEAPASGESRRSTVIPHAFRHGVSSRLYLRVDFVDGRNIPKAAVDRSGVVRFSWTIDSVRFLRPTGRTFQPTNSRFCTNSDILPWAGIWSPTDAKENSRHSSQRQVEEV